MSDNTETAILAGGCFWPAQQLLRDRDGVISTRVGYTGGENTNPGRFWEAEPEDQDDLKHYPEGKNQFSP